MKIITKGSNYSDCGLGYLIMDNLKTLLVSVYGESAVTDARMVAIQKFLSKLDYGNDDGLWGKIKMLCFPFLCDGVASMNAFWDLKNESERRVGYNGFTNSSNVGTYWGFDSYGCYPKHSDNTSLNYAPIMYPAPILAYKAGEFAAFKRIASTEDQAVMSNLTGRTYSTITPPMDCSSFRQFSQYNYMSADLDNGIEGQTVYNLSVLVYTGIGDVAQDKVLTNKGETGYTLTGEILTTVNADRMTIGTRGTDWNGSHAYEQFSFSVFGVGEGLNVLEARILRDALVELQAELGLQ